MEGTTTSKESSAEPPWPAGFVSRGIIFKFEERAGPTVGDDQGERVWAAAALVDEVNV